MSKASTAAEMKNKRSWRTDIEHDAEET
jgi:hypothetical protein